jgi:hypothetical protein
MYEAISSSLDYHPLAPEKISVALAVAVEEYLKSDEASIEHFIEELLRTLEQHTNQKGITTTMKIAREVDVDAAEARMRDKEVEDLYMHLNEDSIPQGLVDYEDDGRRPDPTREALTIALGFAVAMCLKHDAARIERIIADLRSEMKRVDACQATFHTARDRRRARHLPQRSVCCCRS